MGCGCTSASSEASVVRTVKTGGMPELPEVHTLAAKLGSRLRGRSVERLEIVAFAALKLFDPPVSALSGRTVTDVTRHGKFLDLAFADLELEALHLVMHLVRDPRQVRGIARLGPDPLDPGFTLEHVERILAKGGGGSSRGSCACTVAPACRARCAATRCARSSTPIRRSSTARPARPTASRSPTGCCPDS